MAKSDPLEDDYYIHGGHLAAFGAIIHRFARHETLSGLLSFVLRWAGRSA